MLSQSNGREVNLGPTPEVIKLDAACAIKVCAQGSKSVAHGMRKSRAIEAAFLARYWAAAKNGVVKASRRVVHERGTELSIDIGTKRGEPAARYDAPEARGNSQGPESP